MHKRSRQAFEADLQQKESPYVTFGTPLPPLDDKIRDDGSFVPIWKQEVTDERGRKRLHGAFTGGWSAGYFNTVGSKEGWTPATFVSSRKSRVGDGKQNESKTVEDYMDEDDVREAEEARTLQVTSGFEGFGTEDDIARKAGLMDLFRPARSGIGQQLLHKMGWREGQGIGPLVKRAAGLDHDDPDSTKEEHLFAPNDVQMINFIHKTDHKGIGYEAEPSQIEATRKALRSRPSRDQDQDRVDVEDQGGPVLQFTKSTKQQEDVRKLSKRRTGIGVGVLNDNGSDEDDDPYSMGPKIALNKTIGADHKKKTKPTAGGLSTNPNLKTKPVYVAKPLPSLKNALRKCHDGRLPLEGFVFGSGLDSFGAMSLTDDKCKPPTVPDGWISSRAKTTDASATGSYISTRDAARTSNLDITARAQLLHEKALPGKSVFDYLSPAARERLAQLSGNANLPPAKGEAAMTSNGSQPSRPSTSDIPSLDKAIAITALQRKVAGWMPYGEDSQKRERYVAFLESRAKDGEEDSQDTSILAPEDMSRKDWIIELHEFVRAAQVFQPISGSMASRFTSSASLPPTSSDQNTEGGDGDLIRRPTQKLDDPAVAAAKVGMFGPMTRSVGFFYPTRLLCKRFGVPAPDLSAAPQQQNVNEMASHPTKNVYADYASRFQSAGVVTDGEASTTTSIPAKAPIDIETTVGKSTTSPAPGTNQTPVVDPAFNTTFAQERPGIDVFRAIFENDE